MYSGLGCRRRPMSMSILRHALYQCLGLLLRPYQVFLSRGYIFDGVIGQPFGGLITYFSESGRTDCTSAWLASPDLGMQWCCIVMATRKQSSRAEMTGAKLLLFDQLCGSRFPKMMILYLALSGWLFSSVFTLDIVIDGRTFPTIGHIAL